jgi:alginate O-acetyltransferase complex protein AlgI
LWGLAHGLVYITENLINRIVKLKKPENIIAVFVTNTFNVIKTFIIVSFIWILFRAADLQQVKMVCKSIVNNINIKDNFMVETRIWLFFGLFIIIDILLFNNRFDFWCSKRNVVVRWSIYSIMIYFIIVFSSVNNFPFIYFQF